MKTITIKWGTEGNEEKTYTFNNEHDLEMFMKGVNEANGWLEYYVVENKLNDLGFKKEVISEGITCFTLDSKSFR